MRFNSVSKEDCTIQIMNANVSKDQRDFVISEKDSHTTLLSKEVSGWRPRTTSSLTSLSTTAYRAVRHPPFHLVLMNGFQTLMSHTHSNWRWDRNKENHQRSKEVCVSEDTFLHLVPSLRTFLRLEHTFKAAAHGPMLPTLMFCSYQLHHPVPALNARSPTSILQRQLAKFLIGKHWKNATNCIEEDQI